MMSSLFGLFRNYVGIDLFISLFFLFITQHLYADESKTHAFVIYETPLYQNAFQEFIEVTNARGIQSVTVLTNLSGHFDPTSDKKEHANVQKKNLIDVLQKAIHRHLISNKIVKGDQVLIQVLSHGVEKSPGESSHRVLIGDHYVSLDLLKPILKELTQAGVRVGIIDGSCYSGATMTLKSENVCVVSAQVASREAAEDSRKNGTFVDFFWSDLKMRDPKIKVSLESAFLGTRVQRNSLKTTYAWRFDRPQISTSEANVILEPLFDTLDKVRIPETESLCYPIDNLKQQIQSFQQSSLKTLENLNQNLVENMKIFGKKKKELESLEKELEILKEAKKMETHEAFFLKRRDLIKELDALEVEIYKEEAQLYQKYHEELGSKDQNVNPCRHFQI